MTEPRLLTSTPVPVWYVGLPNGQHHVPPFESFKLLMQIAPDGSLSSCVFRGVALQRLEVVLRTGIDMEPPDSVFFGESFEKAWGYGGWPKLLLALDSSRALRTFKTVPAETPAEELALLRETYPTCVPTGDGRMLWLSRLPPEDGRIGSVNEAAYARWIPRDQLGALKAVLVFARPEDDAGEMLAACVSQEPL